MKHVFVLSGNFVRIKNTFDIIILKSILDICNNGLVSIIDGLRQKNFGFDTANKIVNVIKDIKSLGKIVWGQNNKLFVDSGGYSIIKGDVYPGDIYKFISCYCQSLVQLKDTYDYIFSLDIPISLKYSQLNTKEKIYELNYKSIKETIDVIDKYPIINDKLYFVWQFKLKSQYEIWKKIYDDFNLNDRDFTNRAVGGLVGLRDVTQIIFSPFTGMCFRILNDYIKSEKFHKPLRIHILGIYSKSDRLLLSIVEKLFNEYLKEYNTECYITYDSINYGLSTLLKFRNLEVFDLVDNNIIKYDSIQTTPYNTLKRIYNNDSVCDCIMTEINNLESIDRVDSAIKYIPINVFSNINIDNFFMNMVDAYDLINELSKYKSYSQFRPFVVNLYHHLSSKYPDIFTSNMLNAFVENIKILHAFHNWYVNDKTYQKLDDLNYQMIKKINFPFDLT